MNSEENKILNTKITTSLLIKIVIWAVAIVWSVFTVSSKYNNDYSELEKRISSVEKSDKKQDEEIKTILEIKDLVNTVNTKVDVQWEAISRIKKNINN